MAPDPSRYKFFGQNNRLFAYDSHTHTVCELEGQNDEAKLAFAEETVSIPDKPAPDLRRRGRVSNLKLSLSGRCNLACEYCFRGREIPEIADSGTAKSAIDLMVRDFGVEASRYTISFNLTSEPFLKWELLEELSAYTEALQTKIGKPIEWYVLTNGTVRGRSAEASIERFIKKTGRLSLSIDGPESIHDANRHTADGRGTHAQVIEFLGKYGHMAGSVEAQAVLTEASPGPWPVIEYLKELGFDRIITSAVRGLHSEPRIGTRVIDGYNILFDRYAQDLKTGKLDIFKTLRLDHSLRPMWKLLTGIKIGWRCFWGHSHVVADGLGRFWNCDSIIGKPGFQAGSIQTGLDWDIFHENHSISQRNPCSKCWARYICGGTCYVTGIETTGDPKTVDPYECSLNEHLALKNLELLALAFTIPTAYNNLRKAIIG